MKRKVMALLLCVCMVAGILAGCSGSSSSETTTAAAGGSDASVQTADGVTNVLDGGSPVKVAVLRNLWSDRTGTSIEAYAEYLEANFNVEFMLQTLDGSDGQANIAGTENAIAMGAKIVITTIADGLETACKICQDAGAAFGLAYVTGQAEQREILQKYDNYIGTVCAAIDGHSVGEEMAETLISEGKDNFGIVTFTPGMLEDVDTRTAGFEDKAAEMGATIVSKLEESPGSAMITAISTWLELYKGEVEYIIAYGGGTNFVVPALTQSNMIIPIAVPTLPDDYEAYFDSGVLDYIMGFNDDIIAIAMALGINYLNGKIAADTPDERIYECANVVIRSNEEAVEYDSLVSDGNYTFNADEIQNIITAYNPDATYEDVIYLCQTSNLAGIKERHGLE